MLGLSDNEVGARLSLRDKPKFIADADESARAVRHIGTAAKEADVESAGALSRMGSRMGAFSGAVVRYGKYAALGGIAAVTGAMYEGIKGATDYQKVQAQTAAVLKSTQGVAGITAAQVDKLSTSIEKHTAFSEEDVQSTQNLLLTFTRIRNTVGANNDIFTRATGIVGDMSVALGEDLKSASIQVGKALQDPVLGATALRRVGVALTKQQQDQIKTLVAHNHLLAAQKIVLGELTNEFGGSARAAGQTWAGSLTRAKNELKDLLREVALPILPAFTRGVKDAADFITGPFARGMEKAKGFVEDLVHPVDHGRKSVEGFASEAGAAGGALRRWLGPPLSAIAGIVRDDLVPTLQRARTFVTHDLLPSFRNLVNFLEPDLTGALSTAARIGKVVFGGAILLIGHILTGIVGPALKAVTGFLKDHKTAIKDVVVIVGAFVLVMKAQQIWTLLVTKAQVLWAVATNAVAFATNTLKVGVWLLNAALDANPIGIVIGLIVALAAGFVYAYKHSETFRNIVLGVFHAVEHAASVVWGWFKREWPLLLGILGGPFVLAVVEIIRHWDTVKSWFGGLPGMLKGVAGSVVNAIFWPWKTAFNLIADAWNDTAGKLSFHIPSWVPGIGGKGFSMPQIPHWDGTIPGMGGDSTTTVIPPDAGSMANFGGGMRRLHSGGTTVGDQYVNMKPGEEVVRLPSGTTVIPLERETVASALVGAGTADDGRPIVIQVMLDGQKVAETVWQRTRDKVARQ